jgi:hypothetical protein
MHPHHRSVGNGSHDGRNPTTSTQQNHCLNLERLSQDKYDRFEAWLRENGAQFDLVSFIYLFVCSCVCVCVVVVVVVVVVVRVEGSTGIVRTCVFL